jgi:hypothetical protein
MSYPVFYFRIDFSSGTSEKWYGTGLVIADAMRDVLDTFLKAPNRWQNGDIIAITHIDTSPILEDLSRPINQVKGLYK